MTRINLTLPKSMHDALRQESEETGTPMAALIRKAIKERSTRRGVEVDDTIAWGGWRGKSDDEYAEHVD